MPIQEHFEIVRQGTEAVNKWRYLNPFVNLDLYEADLSNINLKGADLKNVNLMKANLYQANFQNADLSESNLQYANLQESNLNGTNLKKTDLSHAKLNKSSLIYTILFQATLLNTDLSEADLTHADLRYARFGCVNLSSTIMKWCICKNVSWENIDLSEVKELDTLIHDGPSSISIDTLEKSRGKVSETFLKGCGVSTEFISYIPSLFATSDARYYSCFICYSHSDHTFAHKLANSLQDYGIRVWLDKNDLQPGESISSQIETGIQDSDKLIVILSEESLKSEWVHHEIARALSIEKRTGKNVLFPIALDDSISNISINIMGKLRERFILNIDDWSNKNTYKSFLSRLAKSLIVSAARDVVEAK